MITTFQQHILQQQREVPYASGDFSWLLSGITLAAKMIEAKIRCAGLCNIVGRPGKPMCKVRHSRSLMCMPTKRCFTVLASATPSRP